MSGLVSGHSGIIAPPNLATNGAFFIDQRGAFRVNGNSYEQCPPVKTGDYLADCWKVAGITTDYLAGAVRFDANLVGELVFFGYGKKGQYFDIENRDMAPLSILYGDAPKHVTATVSYQTGAGSVPVSGWVRPPQRAGYETQLYTQQPVSKNTIRKQAIEVRAHMADELTTIPGLIRITLQEEGEFRVVVSNFCIFAGAFKNPPKSAPVPYADDLARCQRYYQKGRVTEFVRCSKHNSTLAHYYKSVRFPTEMGAIPTVSVSGVGGNTSDGAGTFASASGLTISGNVTSSKEFRLDITVSDASHGPRAFDNGLDYDSTWTAEVV